MNAARSNLALLLGFGLGLVGCGADIGGAGAKPGDVGDDTSNTPDETIAEASSALANGDRATTTADLNLRSGPTTNNRVLLTIPRGGAVDILGRSGVWYSVRYRGTTGWSHGNYLQAAGTSQPEPPASTGSGVSAAMARAVSGVGFSYNWGGGCWDPGSSSKGACYGSCPDCSHRGQWGADCSGYVTKVWQVPGPQAVTNCDRGPYTTSEYYSSRANWSQVSRGSAKRGDAFVRRGHIFLYNGGDAWGSIDAYEAKGCSYGILRNNRSADNSYLVIRRRGF